MTAQASAAATDPEADKELRRVLPPHAHITDNGTHWEARWSTPAGTWTVAHGLNLLGITQGPWFAIKGPGLVIGLSPGTVDKTISVLLLSAQFTAELKRLAGGDFFCGPAFSRTRPDCPQVEIIVKDVSYTDPGIMAARNEKQKALEHAAAQLARAQGEAAALLAEAEGKANAARELEKLYANPAWVALQQSIIQLEIAKACAANPNCHMIMGADGNIVIAPR